MLLFVGQERVNDCYERSICYLYFSITHKLQGIKVKLITFQIQILMKIQLHSMHNPLIPFLEMVSVLSLSLSTQIIQSHSLFSSDICSRSNCSDSVETTNESPQNVYSETSGVSLKNHLLSLFFSK